MNEINEYYNLLEKNNNLLELKKYFLDIKDLFKIPYDLILDNFYVVKIDSEIKRKFFIIYSVHYMIKYHKKIKYIGIDYEFDKNKIALAQFGFYEKIKDANHKYDGIIFITDPNEYNQKDNEIIINSIYTSNIWKILHGADSLDIPYIYSFLKDKDSIIKFTSKMIDTRFLCEYSKITNKTENNKCSIYDAMLYFNAISKSKYDELYELNKKMPPIYKISWKIDKISEINLKYAAYDVLFLRRFARKILKKYTKNDINFIIQLTHLIYYNKHLIKIDSIDFMNNYYISINNKKILLIDIFENLKKHFEKLNNILQIQYFKSTIVNIVKNILYYSIANKYIIYGTSNIKYKIDKSINSNILEILKYYRISKMLEYFNKLNNYFEKNLDKLII